MQSKHFPRLSYFLFHIVFSSDVFVNTTVDIGFAVFASDETSHKKKLEGVCESDDAVRTKNPWASNVSINIFLKLNYIQILVYMLVL